MSAVRLIRSEEGYGSVLWVGSRVRLNSPGALTPMRPHVRMNHDENCNPVATVHLWPIGGVEVWWKPTRPTDADGLCDECRREIAELLA